MIINKTQENGKLVTALDGRLDTAAAPLLQDVLIPAFDEAKEILLDFSLIIHRDFVEL